MLNKQAAKHRHNIALEKFREEHDEQRQKENAHILSRLTALEIEKSRAAKIAKLPPPVKETVDDARPSHPVKCVEDFSTTHYYVTTEYVERAEAHEQVNISYDNCRTNFMKVPPLFWQNYRNPPRSFPSNFNISGQ